MPTDRVGQNGFVVALVIAALALLVIAWGAFTGGDERAFVETTTGSSSTTNAVQTFASQPSVLESTPLPLTAVVVPTPTPFPSTPTVVVAPPTAVPEADDADDSSDSAAANDTAADSGDGDDGETAAADDSTVADDTAAEATATPEPTPTVEETPTAEPSPTAEPTPTPTPGPPPVPRSSAFTHVLRATGDVAIAQVYDAPDGNPVQVTYEYLDGREVQNDLINPTHFGNPLVFRVLEGDEGDDWAKVALPTRPNGQTGWVRTAGYNWGSSNYLVQIDVGTNRVAIFEGDDLVLETQAVTGKESSPTPLLSGYVDDKVYGLRPAYGPVALSLGVFSNALNTFGSDGQSPKIALHGTDRPELMGQYESNGCIRVPNDVIEQISDLVPVGSKVEIIRS